MSSHQEWAKLIRIHEEAIASRHRWDASRPRIDAMRPGHSTEREAQKVDTQGPPPSAQVDPTWWWRYWQSVSRWVT